MIKLERIRTEEAIHENFRGDKRVEFEKELLSEHRKVCRKEIEKHKFPSKWGVVKDQLFEETLKKCAYCESPTAVVAYGDVEHYRPKSKYWWLAYNYDNYLVSCTICNQKYKKAKFPVLNSMMSAPPIKSNTTDDYIDKKAGSFTPDPLNNNEGLDINEFIKRHKDERPLLINPYFDDPQKYFIWNVDTTLEEVELIPVRNDDFSEKCVKAAEDAYGLNRDELKKLRYEVYLNYSTHKLFVNYIGVPAPIKAKSQIIINRLLEDNQPYAGMLKYFENIPVTELP